MERTTQEWKKFRRRLLINPRFQYRFMIYFVGIAVFTLGVFFCAKVYFFHQLSGYLGSLGFRPDHMLYEFLARQSRVMDAALAAAALLESAFLAWVGLKLSHRVAGPLYRLQQEMLRIAKGGDATRLKFRDGDYFEELADAYNEQMNAISARGSPEFRNRPSTPSGVS